MVQTEIAQLFTESAEWRQALRNYRDEWQRNKKELEASCKSTLSREQMHGVEHLNNQIHIQLINIHDLKQRIKNHDRKVELEQSSNQLSEETLAQHEELFEQFTGLENTLQDLRHEFRQFVESVR